MDPSTASRASAQNLIANPVFPAQNVLVGVPWHMPIQSSPSFIQEEPVKNEDKVESEMMPPPPTVPPVRRSPTVVPAEVKREVESPPCGSFAAALQEFVAPDTTLPPISVENYLSRIESPPHLQKALSPTKPELIAMPIPQLNLQPQQSISSLPSPSSVMLEAKMPGLLNEGTQPLLSTSELLFSAPPSSQVPGGGVLLEPAAPVPVQEFVPTQTSSPPAPPTYDVNTLSGHANPGMVYSGENLAVPSSAPGFPPLLPDASFVSPQKSLEVKCVKAEFAGGMIPGQKGPQKKCEDGIPLPHELTQMSENDLLSYINPSCFDQGNASTFSNFFI